MSKLVVAVYQTPYQGTHRWTDAFSQGLERHGIEVRTQQGIAVDKYEFRPDLIEGADLHVFWSMRIPEVIAHCQYSGQPFICIDHGYTDDRGTVKSLNLNGLNGNSALDVSSFSKDSSRCLKHNWHFQERSALGDKIVVMGQVAGDKSLDGVDIYEWAAFKVAALEVLGHRHQDILFKPHPREEAWKDGSHRVGAKLFHGSMQEACEISAVIHTYSSTSGVSAFLQGIPATAASSTSMIYHAQFQQNTPDNKQKWLNELSFRQFNEDELRSGEVWDMHGRNIIGKAPVRPRTVLEPEAALGEFAVA